MTKTASSRIWIFLFSYLKIDTLWLLAICNCTASTFYHELIGNCGLTFHNNQVCPQFALGFGNWKYLSYLKQDYHNVS